MNYCIAYKHRAYQALAHLSIPSWYALSFLALGIPLYAWAQMIYFPSRVLYRTHKQDVAQMPARQAELQQQRAAYKALQEQMMQATATYAEKEQRAATMQEIMTYLFDSAAQTGVTMKSCSISKRGEKEWYTKKHFSVALQASMPNSILFFDHLKKSQSMINSSHVRLTRAENGLFDITFQASVVGLQKEVSKNPST